ncbi:hypothetical protein ACJVC5_05900 [Peredibacter sp. HCB2-198]|uniref:hypothetical protein n=1 Tax=Peredibacter sp. HCB2-198 TaxID=3383025 RepID=UPI0038B4ADDA
MKKLLIIQQDDAYFLFETIQVLEKYQSHLKDFELTLLVNEEAFGIVYDRTSPVLTGFTTDTKKALASRYDISVNLSLKETSWEIHGSVNAISKIGPHLKNGELVVPDLWSSYLLTLKARAPFLTFHLQDVYRNILGLRGNLRGQERTGSIRQIAYGMTSTSLFPSAEQEEFINLLTQTYSHIQVKDISEIDLVSDVSHTLYIGPATLSAIKFCEAGGRGVFLSSNFQGFNLLPYGEGHFFISSKTKTFKANALLPLVSPVIENKERALDSEYAVYSTDHENIFGAYLKGHTNSDDHYPFYQSHLVLWNFLLNLFDVNLEVIKCLPSQIDLLKTHHEVLTKFLRLHDYAMVSIDTVYHESKAQTSDAHKIEGHLKNLREIDVVAEQISASHSLLRPFLDFYRIRRGQNGGQTLHEQAQNSFLTYSEEHQALEALHELFSVTLKRNEVNI